MANWGKFMSAITDVLSNGTPLPLLRNINLQ